MLLPAVGTPLQMRLDVAALHAVDLSVGKCRDQRRRFMAIHGLPPARSATIARKNGERCSKARARASLDRDPSYLVAAAVAGRD